MPSRSSLGVIDYAKLAASVAQGLVSSDKAATGEYKSVPVQTTPTPLLQPNENRKGVLVQNLGTNPVYVGLDTNVTTSNGIQVSSGGGVYSDDTYLGPLVAVADSGPSDVRVQEIG